MKAPPHRSKRHHVANHRSDVLLLLVLVLAGSQIAANAEELTDSQQHALRRIEPQHFEQGAQDSARFTKDHVTYNQQDDRPIHAVWLTKPFYIARHEVTRGQFAAFVKATGYVTTAEQTSRGIVGWDPEDDTERDDIKRSFLADPKYNWRDPGFEQSDDHPVTGVSYKDALAYCRWISKIESATYRLPTEAEWECVCRAGTETSFSFGDAYRNVIHRHANIANVELERAFRHRVNRQWLVDVRSDQTDNAVFTAPVGSYPANAWGVHDMHGNVWEWCRDRYLETYYEKFKRERHNAVRLRAIDPVCDDEWIADGEWRVIRGGSWFNSPVQCRSGSRGFFEAEDAACYLGFRVVREVDSEESLEAKAASERSERALDALRALASQVNEPVHRDLRLEFICDQIDASQLEPLRDVQWPLNIDLRPPGTLSAEMIAAVCEARRLTGVTFRSGGEEVDASSYVGLASHPELEHVQITGVNDLDDRVLNHLRGARGLRSLHLQGQGITDEGLVQLPQLETLQSLFVSSTNIAGTSLERFSGSPLEQASFGNLSDSGAKMLGDFQSLFLLRLTNCPITDDAIGAIAGLRRMRDIQIQDAAVSDEALSKLGLLRHLERVDLRGTGAGDLTLDVMSHLVKLVDLHLDSDQLTDRGVAVATGMVSLRDLSFGPKCNLTDAGLESAWRLVNLTEFRLQNDGVTGTGFKALSELTRLTRMEITSKNLGADALIHLAASPSLEILTIGNWNHEPSADLTPDALATLASSKSLKRVTLVGYREQMDDKSLEALRQKHAEIEWRVR
ncbi:MAG: SUMF1/EgtB/PvdO family nonheme iron enzyme [Planctomycetota bacterium]